MFNPDDYYPTMEDYEEAARNGIIRARVDERIRILAWEKQRAITAPIRNYYDLTELMTLARSNGLNYGQYYYRTKIGWDPISAATIPPRDDEWKLENVKRAYESWRKYPVELINLAASNGISRGLFYKRIKWGWDIQRAAALPPSPHNSAMILNEKYGDDYFKKLQQADWVRTLSRMTPDKREKILKKQREKTGSI